MLFYNKRIFERCFNWRGKRWYRNIKEIPLYFSQMHYLIKHGYDPFAEWETFNWFIGTMESILTKYRSNHDGYPVVSYDDKEKQEQSEREYDADLDRMIELLDLMKEDNPKYDSMQYPQSYEEMYAVTDEFFQLFAKHFYSLWD